ncbi:MAG: heavy metal translocating P-type ATPase [Oscillospiraceae bacterium]
MKKILPTADISEVGVCNCCHDCAHHHEEEESCGCGHEHSHESKDSKIPLYLSIILFAMGLGIEHLLPFPWFVSAVLFGGAAIISGYKVFLSGVKGLVRLQFNENALMSIAIVTAFLLGQFGEAAAVAILFCLGELAEDIAEQNSRKSIAALTEIRPDTARVVTESGEEVVAAELVKIGDTICVNPFERIPVDGTILAGSSYVDNSALTGESIPINVSVGDAILSGAVNGSSKLTVKSTANFQDSTSSRILKLIEESSARKGEAEKLITRFAKIYTPIVLVLSIAVAFLPPLFGWGSMDVWLYRALVMLVASCPCALVISVPLGFFAGIGAQSKIGVLIKGGKYIEALSKADAVVFDKTGTITTSKLKISRIVTVGSIGEARLLGLAAATEARSTHPVAKAICRGAKEEIQGEAIVETPGKGISATVQGQKILVGRRSFLSEEGIDLGELQDMTVYIAVDGALAGGIVLSDSIQEDSAKAIADLRALGITEIMMLTGDNELSAKQVANACGIAKYRAALLPADKARIVEELPGKNVIFIGDGVNDAPVLAAADCGIAMGLGSQAAIETADAVLSAGNLSALPRSIVLARKTTGIIRFNIVFAIGFKAIILVLAALGYAPIWLGIIADVGVMIFTVLNAMRLIRKRA